MTFFKKIFGRNNFIIVILDKIKQILEGTHPQGTDNTNTCTVGDDITTATTAASTNTTTNDSRKKMLPHSWSSPSSSLLQKKLTNNNKNYQFDSDVELLRLEKELKKKKIITKQDLVEYNIKLTEIYRNKNKSTSSRSVTTTTNTTAVSRKSSIITGISNTSGISNRSYSTGGSTMSKKSINNYHNKNYKIVTQPMRGELKDTIREEEERQQEGNNSINTVLTPTISQDVMDNGKSRTNATVAPTGFATDNLFVKVSNIGNIDKAFIIPV
ncbi:uncharacterized protein SCDLUD_002385 [Saccharomycodes ludwigii]|uniref:uncharacterized protein n=1 Tax=Saccharomycodes ludwigii TaxID=36035 RepID=UPI001E834E1C|nr:hypothetical protein SCDLUD_002385 [Saccharomycodes ludwigii]KAH3900925.1 hypothetical protein SCDLUD_002385 [Saccharomycodes ludwigii]